MLSFGKDIFLSQSRVMSSFAALQFIYSQYRVIIAVTAALIAIFPQTYIYLLPSQQYTKPQVRVTWMVVLFTSILAWTLKMVSVYFAMIYRSYLPRYRRQKAISEAVPKKRLDESAVEPNNAESQPQSIREKELKALPKGESQLISEENLQPILEGGPRLPLSAKDQQLASSPSINGRNEDQAKEKS